MLRHAVFALFTVASASAATLVSRAVPGGSYAIQDTTTGLYVVTSSGSPALVPVVGTADEATVFQVGNLGGTSSQFLRDYEQNKLVTGPNDGTSPLEATRDTIGTWEMFDLQAVTGGYRILANSNFLFVSTTSAGLVNNVAIAAATPYAFVAATVPVTTPAFMGGTAFIQDTATSLYLVRSDHAVAFTAATTAEASIFRLSTINNVTSIQSTTSLEYATAPASGTEPLVVSAGAVNTWEQFAFYYVGNGTMTNVYKVKAKSNGRYLDTTTSGGTINSAYSQRGGSLYRVINANPGRRA